MNYVLQIFARELEDLQLFDAVRATAYGFRLDVPSFQAVFELYCSSIGTFFTLV